MLCYWRYDPEISVGYPLLFVALKVEEKYVQISILDPFLICGHCDVPDRIF